MSSTLDLILSEQDAPPPVEAKERPAEVEVLTPSGLTIRYDDRRHFYWINDVKVASVSTILGCLDKPALPWWGMKQGVLGVQALMRDGHLAVELADSTDVDAVVALLTTHKLTVNHVRDKAGERGTTVHDALEAWATNGTVPNPDDYADGQRGYVAGLVAFLTDAKITATSAEMIVGSATHGFAGRYDLEARLEECELVTRLDEKKGTETRETVKAGAYLPDLKTSGAVYPEMFLQVEGYEGARIESGHAPTDARAVVRVTADGRYEFRVSPSNYDAFLAVKRCHEAIVELRAAAKA